MLGMFQFNELVVHRPYELFDFDGPKVSFFS